MRSIRNSLFIVAAFVLLSGCAHSIRITPDSEKLPTADGVTRSPRTVGYFISEEDRSRRVITGGGGGDKVEYAPYRELEAGLFRVLNNVFTNVHSLKTANDTAFMTEKGITLVFRPTIATNSTSPSLLTWPPTEFEVIFDIKAYDIAGKLVWSDVISAKGNAEFSEFKSDFSLAGKRASASALAALQARLLAAPNLR